jgi:hypothetical protein
MRKDPPCSAFFPPQIFFAFFLCWVGAALAVMAFAESDDPVADKNAAVNSATASSIDDAQRFGLRPVDPMQSVRRVLAAYGIIPGQRGPLRTAGSGPGNSGSTPVTLAPRVSATVNAVVSPELRDLPAANIYSGYVMRDENDRRPANRSLPPDPNEADRVLQTNAPAAMPGVGVSFDGMNVSEACGSCLPPDTVGAVGPNHYVQMVNSSIAVYSRTGATVVAPKNINMLWSASPNSICATHNNGDPIVLYDQLADRWLVSQFTVQDASENYAECIAISQTPDPAGAYWLYEFDESPDVFHDYPHLGVWPDGYYMSTNQFPNDSTASVAAGAWVFERPKMLLGQAARSVFFDETPLITNTYTPFGQLPSTLDGQTPPPAGAPNFFAEITDANAPNTPPDAGIHDELRIWKFHVDWTNPANSTFGVGSTAPAADPAISGKYTGLAGNPDYLLPIANFVANQCQIVNGPNDCVPQNSTSGQPPQFLDVLPDRLMFRLAYRNFGTHESLVFNHTVEAIDSGGGSPRTGVRWYEVRNPSTTAVVQQQGTFAPLDPANPLWRWMGSAAMDQAGNLAIGYSASGPNYFPSIHYAGRFSGDPVNELSQGEAVMFPGQGIEANTGIYPFRNRWGDYSALTVDPTDDCTFWYTTEYMVSTPTDILPVDWHTRVGSFKFPNCPSGGAASPTPTATATATATPTGTPSATATATASSIGTPSPTATATATATASPVATATATSTPTATATASGTATATATPTATPTSTPAQLLNISTRLRVQNGDRVLIGGFIIAGSSPKTVLLRGIGPSIKVNGTPLAGRLADPTLELRRQNGTVAATNNDWKDSQQAEIEKTGIAPTDDLESAIVGSFPPGSYTVILRGNGGATGIGVVEAYDLDRSPQGRLANLSTRGFVETDDNVMIGGVIDGPSNRTSPDVVVRALGPSLMSSGVPDALQDPMLEIHDLNGNTIATNDDWASDSNAAKVFAAGLAPSDARESALYLTLTVNQPYTAVVRGKNNGTGVGLVEFYHVK